MPFWVLENLPEWFGNSDDGDHQRAARRRRKLTRRDLATDMCRGRPLAFRRTCRYSASSLSNFRHNSTNHRHVVRRRPRPAHHTIFWLTKGPRLHSRGNPRNLGVRRKSVAAPGYCLENHRRQFGYPSWQHRTRTESEWGTQTIPEYGTTKRQQPTYLIRDQHGRRKLLFTPPVLSS